PTRVFLHQNTDRAHELADTAGLTAADTALLHHLPPGHALWQYGGRTRHVHHLAHRNETHLIDTNTAFR
ncbi:MAG: ATP-binding protein, partial [Acidimicrobiales bacterium]